MDLCTWSRGGGEGGTFISYKQSEFTWHRPVLQFSLSVNQDSFEHALEGESHEEKHPINQVNSRKQGKALGDPYPCALKKKKSKNFAFTLLKVIWKQMIL